MTTTDAPFRTVLYRRVKLTIWLVGAACGIGVGVWFLGTGATPRLAAGSLIEVAPIETPASLDGHETGLNRVLAAALGGSKRFSVRPVAGAGVTAAPAASGRRIEGTACGPGAAALVSGRVEGTNTRYRVTLEAFACATGAPLSLSQSDASESSSLPAAIEDAARRLLVRLGERAEPPSR